ncbi:hypothetical protein [Zoogloea sp.]|uniref:hypothetical protein n=1 Tax=Zoogloea sp. TaxID=49181 RepID=UPI0035AEF24A
MLSTKLALALLALALGLAALAPRLPHLRRRYDSAALSPITRRPEANPGDEALKARLNSWVRNGAGSGASLLPWAVAPVPTPFSHMRLPERQRNAVCHFGYRLAGYHQLDERSRLGGLLYRIGVQLRPLLWFVPRRPDEPWDDAWFDEVDDQRLAALERWTPRRPTLIVLDRLPQKRVEQVTSALGVAAGRAEHPIRLLVLEAQTGHPGM